MSVMTLPCVIPVPVPAARQKNRAEHYWGLIEAFMGRKKLRHAKDYFAALLADQPDNVVEAAIEAVERIVGAPSREEQ